MLSFCSAEWVNSILKQGLKKHFARSDDDPRTSDEFKAAILDQLTVIKDRLQNSRLFLANLEELHRAKDAH